MKNSSIFKNSVSAFICVSLGALASGCNITAFFSSSSTQADTAPPNASLPGAGGGSGSVSIISHNPGASPVAALVAPTPVIFVLGDDGNYVVPTNPTVTGVAPFVLHVSALPQENSHPCYWDPVAWRAAGEHNLCDTDKASITTTNPASLAKFFGQSTALANPQSVESSNPSACFLTPYDAATTALIANISGCIRARDAAYEAQVSQSYLGNGSIYKSEFAWNFGDAGAPYNQVPGFNGAHVFDNPGTYTVTVNVQNEAGLKNTTPVTLNVVVTADNRVPVLISTDQDVLTNIVNYPPRGVTPPAQGRKLMFIRGSTYHITSDLLLQPHDWLTSVSLSASGDILPPDLTAPLPNLISQGAGAVFAGVNNLDILVEQVYVTAGSTRPTMMTSKGVKIGIRDVQFYGVTKGFDAGGSGMLVQNTGMPPNADGSWNSNGLTANFMLYTERGMSFYGNHAYLVASDGNGEPAVRANGGELISIYGSQIGGWTGKGDQISMRGPKNMYFSHNELRGGVFNTQVGTSQNLQPAVVPDNYIVEGNFFLNNSFEIGQGTYNVSFRNNVSSLRQTTITACTCSSGAAVCPALPTGSCQISANNCSVTAKPVAPQYATDPLYCTYPYQNVIETTVSGGYVAGSLVTSNISFVNNTFAMQATVGKAYEGDVYSTNVELVNNLFYTPTNIAVQPGASLASFTKVEGNLFFLNSSTALSNAPNASTIKAWNALPLVASGNTVQDSALPPSDLGFTLETGMDSSESYVPPAGVVYSTYGQNLETVSDDAADTADIEGNQRPAAGGWTPGAFQAGSQLSTF
jgi:PKD repeat protein